MKQRIRPILTLAALASLALVGACDKRSSPVFVTAADRFANTTVGPEYEAMTQMGFGVLRDAEGGWIFTEELTESQRQERLVNLQTFRDAIAEEKGGE